ncbi:MAG: periplasmic protein TonB [Blastocatellia bacterium]|jgi:TonB family protein|nr:periplasmic protein TonB [Blastocatellia bacterium]
MKRCDECGEEFRDKFSFCPVDGARLEVVPGANPAAEYRLTLIDDESLARRLANHIRFVSTQVKQALPAFRNDPIAFAARQLGAGGQLLKQTLSRPHVLLGAMAALVIVSAIILSVLVLERHSPRLTNAIDDGDEPSRTVEIDLRNEAKPNDDSGVGDGEKGRVGFNRGKGEGSHPTPARSQGGGGGGDGSQSPPSQGRVPVPSVIPAPISTTLARLPQALPDAGVDIDPALWKNLSLTSYGDPRSKSTTPSNGPGNGGGVGTNNGTGIGEGDGPGFGPGRKGNLGGGDNSYGCCGGGGSRGNNPDPDRVYPASDVNERARVLSKPEPQYTEEARRNSITGTVVLRVVFSRTGEVTNIHALQPLGAGLTEKAIAAARQIRFVPARKNGQPVSMYMQLEYNFNLY